MWPVSIPSSSGLLFGIPPLLPDAGLHRLNPFFIRSAVWKRASTCASVCPGSQSLLHQVCCLEEPGRALRGDASQSLLHQVCCLEKHRCRSSPTSRSQSLLHQVCCLEIRRLPRSGAGRRLNTFFIRSAVWNGPPCGPAPSASVSIPSSSGLLFGIGELADCMRKRTSQSLLHQVCCLE